MFERARDPKDDDLGQFEDCVGLPSTYFLTELQLVRKRIRRIIVTSGPSTVRVVRKSDHCERNVRENVACKSGKGTHLVLLVLFEVLAGLFLENERRARDGGRTVPGQRRTRRTR